MTRIGLLMLALGIPVSATCGAAEHRSGDIVLITVDTLRPDHLGIYGYERNTSPNLTRWFREGTVFRRAYSTEAKTSPSVVSLLTGKLPQEHGVRLLYQLLPDDRRLITDLLPEIYQTAAFVSNIVLTDEALGIADRFEHYDDFVDQKEPHRVVYERDARRTTDAALRWLEEERNPDRPLFLWIHYIDPHGPYLPPDSWPATFRHDGRVPIGDRKILEYLRMPSVTDGLVYVDWYDEEIAFVDSQIDRLLESSAKQIDLDDSLVIFTADHGESMMEHERWFIHGYHVYDELVKVPLMIRGPGAQRGQREELVSGIDIAPTVLGFAGVDVPDDLRGLDLRRIDSASADRTIFAESSSGDWHWRAAIAGNRKWMVRLSRGERAILERRVYDLETDPAEATPNRFLDNEPAAQALLGLCQSDPDPGGLPTTYPAGTKRSTPKVALRSEETTLEALRALGYVD